MSVDPANQYHSPYVYSGNNPIVIVDPDGRAGGHYSYVNEAMRLANAQKRGASAAELGQIAAHASRSRTRDAAISAGIVAGAYAGGAALLRYAVPITTGYLANAPRINEYAAMGFEALLLPGGESLVPTGAAISAFRGFAKSGGFETLAKKIGIEGLTGIDLRRAFGGLLTRRRGGQETRIITNELKDLIGKPGGGTLEGGKIIDFITDNRGNVLVVVLEQVGDDLIEVGNRTLKASELPFAEFGLDASRSFGHHIGKWKDEDGLYSATQ